MIHGQGVTKEYGDPRTDKKYKDFQMTLRFMCEADGNSGRSSTPSSRKARGRHAGAAVRDRPDVEPSHRRPLRRQPQLGRVARARIRDHHPAERLELHARHGRRQSLYRAPEWRAARRLHRSQRRSRSTATSPCSSTRAAWATCGSRISISAIPRTVIFIVSHHHTCIIRVERYQCRIVRLPRKSCSRIPAVWIRPSSCRG